VTWLANTGLGIKPQPPQAAAWAREAVSLWPVTKTTGVRRFMTVP
jgi:hypothetical protein